MNKGGGGAHPGADERGVLFRMVGRMVMLKEVPSGPDHGQT